MFTSRSDAGRKLTAVLKQRKIIADVVIGLARGGVIVAAEIAKSFELQLYPLPVKKLGAPQNEELAIGAITQEDTTFIDEQMLNLLDVSSAYLKSEISYKQQKLQSQQTQYQTSTPDISLIRKNVVLVDDGVATGATLFATILFLKKKSINKIIIALPVAQQSTFEKLKAKVDTIVVLEQPIELQSVGQFYQDFRQVTDKEVIDIIRKVNSL